MKVLLSIKPEYAIKIFEGSKRYEYRKAIFKRDDIEKIVVYASYPVQMVIGEFYIERIMKSTPSKIWEETKDYSGISEELFQSYFHERNIAYAIRIAEKTLYQKPKKLNEIYGQTPPQSYAYID